MGVIKFDTRYITVDKAHSGEKLFQFLCKVVDKKVPKSAIMKWIRTGQVRINSKRAKPYVRIKEGERIRIPPHYIDIQPLKENSRNPFDLKKVFENEDFLVLDKPPMLCVQPGKDVEDSVYHRLKRVYGNNFYLVHRLDKETSGLLIIAKSYSYLQHLQKLWFEDKIKKLYLAWVNGNTSWWNWTELEEDIEIDGKMYHAISYVKTLKNQKKYSLVMVKLSTGRKHQIRIQLAKRDLPVVGDKKYGTKGYHQGLLLHAFYLAWDEYSFYSKPRWLNEFEVSEEMIKSLLKFKNSLP